MKRVGLLSLAIVLVVQLSAVYAAEPSEQGLSAYVTALALHVRSGPGVRNPVLGTLLEYDPVVIQDHARAGGTTWYAIEAAGGYVDGWVSGAYIAFGKPPIGFTAAVDYGKPETPTLVKGAFKYVGVAGCKKCHVESTGDFPRGAYPVWKGHLHSSAYQSLQRAYTKVIAKRRRGVDDPATDWRCVKCHVTAYGAEPAQLAPSYRQEDGVTCEVCHGPGSAYADIDHGPSNPARFNLGFNKLVDLEEREALCVRCHNPTSPTYKPFNLEAFSGAILHWVDMNDAAYTKFAAAAARRREQALARRKKPATPAGGKRPAPTAAATAAVVEKKAAPTVAEQEPTRPMATRKPAPTTPRAHRTATAVATRPPATAVPTAPHPPATRAATPTRTLGAPTLTPTRDRGAQRTQTARARSTQAAAAEAALKRKRESQAAERKRQEREARAAESAAKEATGLARYLRGLPEVFTLNKDGKKYLPVRFTHATHSSKGYVPGSTCQTCHHTQEGDEKPEKCSECHNVGGDAEETKAKTRATHSKQDPFPKEPGQEAVSCVGCHLAQNALLEEGKRSGKEAPRKCTGCHKKKRR
ncbi:MAG: cytochrome c3 family protein [Candidatus Binatia bacterium]